MIAFRKIICSILAFLAWWLAIRHLWQNENILWAIALVLLGVGVIGSLAVGYYKKIANRRW